MLTRRRAVSNIVATMIIFMIMSAATAFLYSEISPTIIGHQADSATQNQEFIFLSVQAGVDQLLGVSSGAENRVHIISNGATYDVDSNARSLQLTIFDGVVNQSFTSALGIFDAVINANFQSVTESHYLGNYAQENTYVNTNQTESAFSSIAYMDVESSSATISLYYRASADIYRSDATTYVLNVFIYQLTVDAAATFTGFPVTFDEWTLITRRGESSISNPFNVTMPAAGNLQIYQSLDGSSIGLDTYQYPFSLGDTIIVNFVSVPIYFEF